MQAIIAQQEEGLTVECKHELQLVGYVWSAAINATELRAVECADCGKKLDHPLVKEKPDDSPV